MNCDIANFCVVRGCLEVLDRLHGIFELACLPVDQMHISTGAQPLLLSAGAMHLSQSVYHVRQTSALRSSAQQRH